MQKKKLWNLTTILLSLAGLCGFIFGMIGIYTEKFYPEIFDFNLFQPWIQCVYVVSTSGFVSILIFLIALWKKLELKGNVSNSIFCFLIEVLILEILGYLVYETAGTSNKEIYNFTTHLTSGSGIVFGLIFGFCALVIAIITLDCVESTKKYYINKKVQDDLHRLILHGNLKEFEEFYAKLPEYPYFSSELDYYIYLLKFYFLAITDTKRAEESLKNIFFVSTAQQPVVNQYFLSVGLFYVVNEKWDEFDKLFGNSPTFVNNTKNMYNLAKNFITTTEQFSENEMNRIFSVVKSEPGATMINTYIKMKYYEKRGNLDKAKELAKFILDGKTEYFVLNQKADEVMNGKKKTKVTKSKIAKIESKTAKTKSTKKTKSTEKTESTKKATKKVDSEKTDKKAKLTKPESKTQK